MRTRGHISIILLTLLVISCTEEKQLLTVSQKQFSEFVASTNYVTEAERFGWSFVQVDVYNFKVVENANWRYPNGVDASQEDMPVTQISFNDALAYCQWSGTQLPNYESYWKIVADDPRNINIAGGRIFPSENINLVGNVWDITTTENKLGEIRLAGGSYLCDITTCNGSSPDRRLFVDKTTANSHIGFSVLK